MGNDVSLITTIAVSFGFALIAGVACMQLRISPIVGYLLAGVLIGPATPGYVADIALSSQLAEIGVMLLMFGVGLEFSLNDLLAVRRVAVPGALMQVVASTALGALVAMHWGWNIGSSLVFGIAISVASTVVMLRALESRGTLQTVNGQIAVGWLIVQDLIMVLVLVLLPAFSGALGGTDEGADYGDIAIAVGITLAKVALFIGLMVVVGKRLFPALLLMVARSGSRELFTLCVVAGAIAVAYASARLFDVSFALGAFFAGTMMGESRFSHRAAQESLPLRDAFSVLFFVSVGMLFDPLVLIEHPGKVLAVSAVILLGSPLVAMTFAYLRRYPLDTALLLGASLGQIGEFSFILASLGTALQLLPLEGRSLILAAALISISLNPLMFTAVGRALKWLQRHPTLLARLSAREDRLAALPMSVPQEQLSGQVVIVGYGRVGSRIAESLETQGISYVVAEVNREVVEELRKRGVSAVAGDASRPEVLIQAHIAHAAMLVVATPDISRVQHMADIAQTLNPAIEIIVRTHTDEEGELLESRKVGKVFMGEHELANAMSLHVLQRMGRA